ncbi:hypothetical protein YC2023_106097 [Brassica napus]
MANFHSDGPTNNPDRPKKHILNSTKFKVMHLDKGLGHQTQSNLVCRIQRRLLYLIALGTGGIKPCVSSFGADQFDDTGPIERVNKASFFNWFYFSINIGSFVSSTLLVWVQENSGWGLGFMIPTVFMGLSTLMGIGLFLSVLSIAAAAVVETVRLQLARDAVSMSIFWQGPQYMLMGIAEVFFFIGRLEFFYEQSPDAMRSLCSALALLLPELVDSHSCGVFHCG